ncbi:hypothetical protein [Streptomyces zaomyceticus]|uniref:hypothetical protein n=1 Tax=Streptomyces zaomyceticus TaxID=68286 RepID=UPI003679D3AB
MAADDFFASLNPLTQLGLNTATTSGPSAAGAGLPVTSQSQSFDHGEKPWHPDSPIFWVAMIGIASFVGIVGASVNVHAGPAKAGASIGK